MLLLFFWWVVSQPGLVGQLLVVVQANASSSVLGPPTISAAFINQVLSVYHSPAEGLGQALYDDGIQYGIDPVYALAFFRHESSFGTTGEARKTLSLGNERCLPDRACSRSSMSFSVIALASLRNHYANVQCGRQSSLALRHKRPAVMAILQAVFLLLLRQLGRVLNTAFGWATLEINGHDLTEVLDAFATAQTTKGRPTAVVARTIVGATALGGLGSRPPPASRSKRCAR